VNRFLVALQGLPLETADLLIAMTVACQRSEGRGRFIDAEEIVEGASDEVKRSPKPFDFRVMVYEQGRPHRLPIIPDAVFGLQFLTEPEGRQLSFFFVEIDRGTMSVSTRYLQKLRAYHQMFYEQLHVKRYQRKSWRVLTVTNDASKEERRLKNMLMAEREAASLVDGRMPVNLFLFTTTQRLDYGNVLLHEWLNSRGERKAL
jgi:hypothetical protein